MCEKEKNIMISKNALNPEPIMRFNNFCNDLQLLIVHDDREEGLGYYVDFEEVNGDTKGTIYYAEDLNNAISFSKTFSSTHSFSDLISDYDYA